MATTFKIPKNGSKSLVATAPSPATSGTTLVVTSGQGSRFALGWATIWGKGSNYDARDDTNAETVLITAISTDTLTITRAQLGTAARTVVVGDAIEMLLVDQQFKDIHTAVNAIENTGPAVMINPYKFSAYRNAAFSTTGGSYVKVPFDTKEFDTSTNFDAVTNNRFTAPVAGVYQLNWVVSPAATSTDSIATLYKNGSQYKWGTELVVAGLASSVGSSLVLAAASDFFEVWIFTSNSAALSVGSTRTFFNGFLVSI